ncbi:hypothetical protein Agub_g11520, partial [Astrephomene gubernaculifera]
MSHHDSQCPADGDAMEASLLALSQLPPGLVNLGNSCYMNSALQALASSQRFCAYISERAQAVQYGMARIQAAETTTATATSMPYTSHHQQQQQPTTSCHKAPPPRVPRGAPVLRPHQEGYQRAEEQEKQEEEEEGVSQEEDTAAAAVVARPNAVAYTAASPAAASAVAPAAAAATAAVAAAAAHQAAAVVLQPLVKALCRTWLWLKGWEPPPPAHPPPPPPPPHLRLSSYTHAAPRRTSPNQHTGNHQRPKQQQQTELQRLAACRLLLQLHAVLQALQPRYSPQQQQQQSGRNTGSNCGQGLATTAGVGTTATATAAAAAAAAAVNPWPLLRELRDRWGGVLQLGEQHDASEALGCLCDSLDSELAMWHLMYGRWIQTPPLLQPLLQPPPLPGKHHSLASTLESVRQVTTAADAETVAEVEVEVEAASEEEDGMTSGAGVCGQCNGGSGGSGGSHRLASGEVGAGGGGGTAGGGCSSSSSSSNGGNSNSSYVMGSSSGCNGANVPLPPNPAPAAPLLPPPPPPPPPASPLRGLMRTCSTCCACGNRSPTHVEPFWSLQLPLPPPGTTPPARNLTSHPSSTTSTQPATAAPSHPLHFSSHTLPHPLLLAQQRRMHPHPPHRHPHTHQQQLTLRDCLAGAVVSEEVVEGVVCARCSLAVALRRAGVEVG